MKWTVARRSLATLGLLGSLALAAAAAGQSATTLSVQVVAGTLPVAALAGSATPVTTSCPAGSTLSGGGIEAFTTLSASVGVLEPIDGLVVRGVMSSDPSGDISANGAVSQVGWTAIAGFAGQDESGDEVTGYAMCESGDSAPTQIVTASVDGPTTASTTEGVTATCPAGTTLIGGGANVTPASEPSIKPVGSYPSTVSGTMPTSGQANPTSWTAVGESGGLMLSGSNGVTTTALAICLDDATLQTQVAVGADLDHPSGPGDLNAGSDPVATVTATCPAGSTMLDGGALASEDPAYGPEIQQGVHLRGSYPSGATATPVTNGATNPTSWSAIVQAGGQATPGTDSYAYALCAQLPPASAPTAGASGPVGASGASVASTPAAQTVSRSAKVARGVAGSLKIGTGDAAVTAAWGTTGLSAGACTLTATLTPSVVSGTGPVSGPTAVLFEASATNGVSISRFTAPLNVSFLGAPGNLLPASSANGRSWSAVPLLAAPQLPGGFADGYYRDQLGTLHILTRVPGYLALVDTPSRLSTTLAFVLQLPSRLRTTTPQALTLGVESTLRAAFNVTLSRAGNVVASWRPLVHTPLATLRLRLPHALAPGRYVVAVTAQAGARRVRHSAAITVVPG